MLRSAFFIVGLLLLGSCDARTDKGATVTDADAASKPAVAERQPCLNLNTASAEELTRLPGVGEILARRIIAYREQHGPLRRAQEIIIIDGFSERKFRAIAEMVCV